MNTGEVARINTERLQRWGEILTEAHATPAVLIGIAHDREAGVVRVFMPESLPAEMARAYLKLALASLGE